jgi:hypothetical protein
MSRATGGSALPWASTATSAAIAAATRAQTIPAATSVAATAREGAAPRLAKRFAAPTMGPSSNAAPTTA